MHIPDGYLSPGTCATLYVAAAPFWLIALRRVRRAFASRSVPLLAVFSAFSFTVMMFNVPLPGGTTGHAVGVGLTAVVLGPFFSVLAISTALLIQALLFGDGGLTTFGANCFNMAVIGSFVSYAGYRLLAFRSSLYSRRRALAAGLGGYVGINASALCAAIEFGIQPRYFHDAAGTPLYAPYGLQVTIPAMMIGHLTFAGLAELVISAGVIAYLQRSDVSLLRATAREAPDADEIAPVSNFPSDGLVGGIFGSRKVWIVLAVLLILTPLGIIAAGSAWGEWLPTDYRSAAGRSQITAASGHHALPSSVPQGLEHLSGIWLAPLSGYAPSFLHNRYGAYFLSGLIGVMAILITGWSVARVILRLRSKHSPIRKTFLERTVDRLTAIAEESLYFEQSASRNGLLQRIDERVKLGGIAGLLVAVVMARHWWMMACLFLLSLLLALWGGIAPAKLVLRIWIPVFAFTGLIALPALFLVSGGANVWRVPALDLAVTERGLQSACFLITRTLAATTLVFSIVATTPWNRLLRALRFFGVPAFVVSMVEMSYRYIWTLLRTAQDMFEARRARSLGPLALEHGQQITSSAAGVLFTKSFGLSSDIHLAMQARGFRGEILLLDEQPLTTAGRLQLAVILLLTVWAVYAGR